MFQDLSICHPGHKKKYQGIKSIYKSLKQITLKFMLIYFHLFYRCQQRIPLNMGVHVVKEDMSYVIKRNGKFSKIIECGIHILNLSKDKIMQFSEHSINSTSIGVW